MSEIEQENQNDKGEVKKEETTEQEKEETLEEKLKKCEEEKARYYDNWLRAEAELDNYKKRVIKEREEFRKFALEGLIKDLLTPIDYLEMAISHAKTTQNVEALIQGVEYTLKSLLDILKNYGLEPVDASGKTFDPSIHEAQDVEIREDVEEGTIIKEHRKAYKMWGRLLRAALVTVAKKPEKIEENQENKELKANESKEEK
jgi:molecular chaperone GrpE